MKNNFKLLILALCLTTGTQKAEINNPNRLFVGLMSVVCGGYLMFKGGDRSPIQNAGRAFLLSGGGGLILNSIDNKLITDPNSRTAAGLVSGGLASALMSNQVRIDDPNNPTTLANQAGGILLAAILVAFGTNC